VPLNLHQRLFRTAAPRLKSSPTKEVLINPPTPHSPSPCQPPTCQNPPPRVSQHPWFSNLKSEILNLKSLPSARTFPPIPHHFLLNCQRTTPVSRRLGTAAHPVSGAAARIHHNCIQSVGTGKPCRHIFLKISCRPNRGKVAEWRPDYLSSRNFATVFPAFVS
jgi:hypothetical protein